ATKIETPRGSARRRGSAVAAEVALAEPRPEDRRDRALVLGGRGGAAWRRRLEPVEAQDRAVRARAPAEADELEEPVGIRLAGGHPGEARELGGEQQQARAQLGARAETRRELEPVGDPRLYPGAL